jgi:hypothetical protein
MFEIIEDFSRDFLRRALQALVRHPAMVILGLATAGVFSGHIAGLGGEESFIWWLLMASLVGVSTLTLAALEGLGAIKRGARSGLTALFVLLACLYATWLHDSASIAEGWRYGMLVVALLAALSAAPLAARHSATPAEARFWRFNSRLAGRATLCVVYLGLLFIGLLLGLVATASLFGIMLDDKWVGHIFVWVFFGIGPWMLMAGYEEVVDVDRPISEVAVGRMAKLGAFLILPLISLYLLINYGYSLRVVFTDFAPSNVISPLVLGAGLLGFAGLYLVEPLRHRSDYELLSRIFQCFPVALLVVLPLSAWAVFERIDQYGWTEFRYVRLLVIACFGILCIHGGIRLMRRQTMNLSAIPLVVGAGFLLASMGPWGAIETARTSQIKRTKRLAAEAGALNPGATIDVSRLESASAEQKQELRRATDYLLDHHGEAALAHVAVEDGSGLRVALNRALSREDIPERTIHLNSAGEVPIDHRGTLLSFSHSRSHWSQSASSSRPRSTKITKITIDDEHVVFDGEEGRWRASMEELIALGEQEPPEGLIPVGLRSTPLLDEHDRRIGSLLVDRIRLVLEGRQGRVESIEGYILLE